MDSMWRFYKLPKDVAGRTDLSASAKIVLAVLIDRIGQNDCCWPGIRCLAKDSGLSRPAIIDALRKLETKELVQIERRSKGQSNRYRLGNWSRFFTIGGQETLPEVVKKLDHNKKDPLNQTHIYNCSNSEPLRLAKLLLDLIVQRKADFKRPNLQSWARHIERMILIDKRKPERIEAVIRWCQADAFEQINVLSTEKLRIRFDQLEMKMAGYHGKQQMPSGIPNRTKYNRDFTGQESSVGTVIAM